MSLPLASTVLAIPGELLVRIELRQSPLSGEFVVLRNARALLISHDYAVARQCYRAEVDSWLNPSN